MALLLVYTPDHNARTRYALETFCRDLMGCDLLLCDDPADFIQHPGPKLTYAPSPIDDSPFIWKHALMEEQGLRKVDLDFFDYLGFPAYFQSPYPEAILPFDVFAAAFYRLSRYDEYLPFKADAYGRFPVDQDPLAHVALEHPVLDYWAKDLSARLQAVYPSLSIEKLMFQFKPSFDVDHAYAYRGRRVLRHLGAWAKALMKGRWREVWERPGVLLGLLKDPFDTYDWIIERCQEHGLQAHFFILQGRGRLDKAVPIYRKQWRKTLQRLDQEARIGYHPSMASNKRVDTLKADYQRLQQIVKQPVNSARQHFLFLNIPLTFRQLVDIGIEEDYSLTYPNKIGFRAGTSRSFYAFDLLCDQVLPLRLYPACAMDRSFLHQGLTPDQAIEALQVLCDRVRETGGDFTCIFHNETFSERGEWRGWRRVFKTLLTHASTPVS